MNAALSSMAAPLALRLFGSTLRALLASRLSADCRVPASGPPTEPSARLRFAGLDIELDPRCIAGDCSLS